MSRKVAVAAVCAAVTSHSGLGFGSFARALVMTPAQPASAVSAPVVATGNEISSFASPGIQTSWHMSHSARAFNLTSRPGVSVIGGGDFNQQVDFALIAVAGDFPGRIFQDMRGGPLDVAGLEPVGAASR